MNAIEFVSGSVSIGSIDDDDGSEDFWKTEGKPLNRVFFIVFSLVWDYLRVNEYTKQIISRKRLKWEDCFFLFLRFLFSTIYILSIFLLFLLLYYYIRKQLPIAYNREDESGVGWIDVIFLCYYYFLYGVYRKCLIMDYWRIWKCFVCEF